MHSDIGLFLVMSVAEVFDLVTFERLQTELSLLLELPDGRVVRPVPPANSMLVMNGEGSTLWVPASTDQVVQPWAPAHEVAGVELHGMEWARAWFGRMYFPSRSARLRGSDMTFNDYRQLTHHAFRHGEHLDNGALTSIAAVAGCSPGRRMLADEGSCGADEVRGQHAHPALGGPHAGRIVYFYLPRSTRVAPMCVSCCPTLSAGLLLDVMYEHIWPGLQLAGCDVQKSRKWEPVAPGLHGKWQAHALHVLHPHVPNRASAIVVLVLQHQPRAYVNVDVRLSVCRRPPQLELCHLPVP